MAAKRTTREGGNFLRIPAVVSEKTELPATSHLLALSVSSPPQGHAKQCKIFGNRLRVTVYPTIQINLIQKVYLIKYDCR